MHTAQASLHVRDARDQSSASMADNREHGRPQDRGDTTHWRCYVQCRPTACIAASPAHPIGDCATTANRRRCGAAIRIAGTSGVLKRSPVRAAMTAVDIGGRCGNYQRPPRAALMKSSDAVCHRVSDAPVHGAFDQSPISREFHWTVPTDRACVSSCSMRSDQ
jgi:hypothetical protein